MQALWCKLCGAGCVVQVEWCTIKVNTLASPVNSMRDWPVFCVLVHRGVIVRQYNVQEEDCMAR